MAALVQSYPQQSTVTMLQTRPASSSGHFSQNNRSHQRGTSMPRNVYGADSGAPYRGQTAALPVAPYAFTATPSLQQQTPREHQAGPFLRSETRTLSPPPTLAGAAATAPPLALGSLPDVDTSDLFSPSDVSRLNASDHTSPARAQAALDGPPPSARPGPNRYRQSHKRAETGHAVPGPQPASGPTGGSAAPSGSGMDAVGHLYNQPVQAASAPSLMPSANVRRSWSKDDSELDKQRTSKQAKRYSRRSIAPVAAEDARLPSEPRYQNPPPPPIRTYASVVSAPYVPERKEHRPLAQPQQRPTSSHARNESDESISSSSRSTSRPTVSLPFVGARSKCRSSLEANQPLTGLVQAGR